MDLIAQILKDAGYAVIEGEEAVLQAIENASDGIPRKLCSGYKMFPDGTKCCGCQDCQGE